MMIQSFSNKVILGDCRKSAIKLPDNSIQAIITSPPYFGLRKYSEHSEKEIGREKELSEYIANLSEVFSILMSKLRDDGVLWLNLGDSYSNKALNGAPWRVALALQDIGWFLRSDIIWHKPNAMPSSVKDRPTTDHEYLFMFTKSVEYFYNADAIREPHVTFSEKSRMKGGRNHFGKKDGTPENGKNGGDCNLHDGRWDQAFHPKGRNKRTVWEIPLSKFRDTHFAVYPEKLVETCVLASSKKGSFVLDPFTGSGTTGVVCKKMGRQFVGYELEEKYQKMAQKRIDDIVVQESLFDLPMPSIV